nr:MAG TPA: hypothetical protein [Caudoviricetes sp.]
MCERLKALSSNTYFYFPIKKKICCYPSIYSEGQISYVPVVKPPVEIPLD